MSIKVGQVYETKSGLRYIVTCVRTYNICILYDTGYCMGVPPSDMNKIYIDKLIAEYPTWKEAINSKEFKNE